jgi:hypothetical protein
VTPGKEVVKQGGDAITEAVQALHQGTFKAEARNFWEMESWEPRDASLDVLAMASF